MGQKCHTLNFRDKIGKKIACKVKHSVECGNKSQDPGPYLTPIKSTMHSTAGSQVIGHLVLVHVNLQITYTQKKIYMKMNEGSVREIRKMKEVVVSDTLIISD